MLLEEILLLLLEIIGQTGVIIQLIMVGIIKDQHQLQPLGHLDQVIQLGQ